MLSLKSYTSFLDPWNQLAQNAPFIMAIRMIQMPIFQFIDPIAGCMENKRMVGEKVDAMIEYQQLLVLWPMNFYWDILRASMTGSISTSFDRALQQSNRRLAKPYTSRVSANHRRLSVLKGK